MLLTAGNKLSRCQWALRDDFSLLEADELGCMKMTVLGIELGPPDPNSLQPATTPQHHLLVQITLNLKKKNTIDKLKIKDITIFEILSISNKCTS